MSAMKKFSITFAIGLVIAAAVACSKELFAQTDPVRIFHILCDSFCVSGVLLAGFGALIFVSNEGAFDGLTYCLRSFAQIFRKPEFRVHESYFDYTTRRSRNQKKFSFSYILLCGLLHLAICLVMYALYRYYSA